MNIDPARLEANWRAIARELDAPHPTRVERLLRRVGIPPSITRVLVATPALRRAWFLAIAVAVVVGLGATDAADPRDTLFTWLFLAPLVPVLGVSLAYGSSADPSHETTLATPTHGLRLLAIRVCVVLTVSVVILGTASLLAPERSLLAIAWLLPALALTAADVALMTWTSPRRATAVTIVTWVVIVLVVRGAAADPLAVFGPVTQIIAAVATIVAGTVSVVRRDQYDQLVIAR